MVIKITESQLKVLENYLNNNVLTEAPGVGPTIPKTKPKKNKTKGKGGFSSTAYKKIKKFTKPKFFGTSSPEELRDGLDKSFETMKKKWKVPTALEVQKKQIIDAAFDKGRSNLDYETMSNTLAKLMNKIANNNNLMANPEVKDFYTKLRVWMIKPAGERARNVLNQIVLATILASVETLIELPFRDSYKDVTVAKPFLKTWPIEKELLELLRTEGSVITIDGVETPILSDDANNNATSDFKVTITKSGKIFVITLNPQAQIDMKPVSQLYFDGKTFYYETSPNVKIKTLLTTVGSSIEIQGKGPQQITDEDIKHNKNLIIKVSKSTVRIPLGAKINGVFYNNFIWNNTDEELMAIKTLNLDNFKLYLKNLWKNDYTGTEKITVNDDNITVNDGVKTFYFNFNDGNFTCLNCEE